MFRCNPEVCTWLSLLLLLLQPVLPSGSCNLISSHVPPPLVFFQAGFCFKCFLKSLGETVLYLTRSVKSCSTLLRDRLRLLKWVFSSSSCFPTHGRFLGNNFKNILSIQLHLKMFFLDLNTRYFHKIIHQISVPFKIL